MGRYRSRRSAPRALSGVLPLAQRVVTLSVIGLSVVGLSLAGAEPALASSAFTTSALAASSLAASSLAASASAEAATSTRSSVAQAAAGLPAGTVVGGDELAATGTVDHLAAGAQAPPATKAAGWLVADLTTRQILVAHNVHTAYAQASTMKIFTALTLQPRLDPATVYTASHASTAVDGTKVGLVAGSKYTVDQLFHGMIMSSGNDCAVALGELAGGLPTATSLMQREARSLGAFDTTVKTVDGLDVKGQGSSAYDLALAGSAALQNPALEKLMLTKTFAFPSTGTTFDSKRKTFSIQTHNKLLFNLPGATGVKNGYTVNAEGSFVGSATRNGHSYIAVVLRSKGVTWKQSDDLLTWAFANGSKASPVGTLITPAAAAALIKPPTAAAQVASGVAAELHGAQLVSTSGLLHDHTRLALLGALVLGLLLVLWAVRSMIRARRRRKASPPNAGQHVYAMGGDVVYSQPEGQYEHWAGLDDVGFIAPDSLAPAPAPDLTLQTGALFGGSLLGREPLEDGPTLLGGFLEPDWTPGSVPGAASHWWSGSAPEQGPRADRPPGYDESVAPDRLAPERPFAPRHGRPERSEPIQQYQPPVQPYQQQTRPYQPPGAESRTYEQRVSEPPAPRPYGQPGQNYYDDQSSSAHDYGQQANRQQANRQQANPGNTGGHGDEDTQVYRPIGAPGSASAGPGSGRGRGPTRPGSAPHTQRDPRGQVDPRARSAASPAPPVGDGTQVFRPVSDGIRPSGNESHTQGPVDDGTQVYRPVGRRRQISLPDDEPAAVQQPDDGTQIYRPMGSPRTGPRRPRN